MIPYSNKFNIQLMNDNRRYIVTLEMILANEQPPLTLTNADIWANTLTIEDATSEPSKFTVGSAVTAKMSVTINNIYDKFSIYNFTNAQVKVKIGLEIEEGVIESRYVGTFIIDETHYNGSTINISGLDYMCKFDRPYSDVKTTYPATIYQILMDICRVCEVNCPVTSNLSNANMIVTTDPTTDGLSCGQMIAYIAQVNCKYAKVDVNGELRFDWYDATFLKDGLEGGSFKYDGKGVEGDPESTVDGGSYTKKYITYKDEKGITRQRYADGWTPSATTSTTEKYHVLASHKNFEVSTDDSIITGVRVTDKPINSSYQTKDKDGNEITKEIEPQTVFRGHEGYVIEISENPLIQCDEKTHTAGQMAEFFDQMLIGTQFRVFSATMLSDPSVEAGDVGYLVDNKGNVYITFISTRKFTAGGSMTVSCDAETPLKNSQTIYSAQTQAYLKAKDMVEKERTSREIAMNAFNVALSNASGLYSYEEEDADNKGAKIYYLKDKNDAPNKEKKLVTIGKNSKGQDVKVWRTTFPQSKLIWQMSSAGLAISNDGGFTYPYGLSSFGTALLETVYSIGLDANHITAGQITVGGNGTKNAGSIIVNGMDNKEIGKWDNTGLTVKKGSISGTSLTVGGLDNVDGSITVNGINEKKETITIGKWDKDGLISYKGTLSGASLSTDTGENGNYITIDKGKITSTYKNSDGSTKKQSEIRMDKSDSAGNRTRMEIECGEIYFNVTRMKYKYHSQEMYGVNKEKNDGSEIYIPFFLSKYDNTMYGMKCRVQEGIMVTGNKNGAVETQTLGWIEDWEND